MTDFIRAIPSGDTKLRDICRRCGFINYENPSVLVETMAFDIDGRMLVRKGAAELLPSGVLHAGETSKAGASRMATQEAGVAVSADHILTVSEHPESAQVLLTFRGHVDGSLPEGNAFEFIAAHDIESRLSGHPVQARAHAIHIAALHKNRFEPGHLLSEFSKAAASSSAEMALPCGDCSFDKGRKSRIVSGVVAGWEDKILLCRRAIEPRKGFWTLPSGFLEMGETLREGAARETLEEAEAAVDVGKLLVIYEIPKIGQVLTIYRGALRSPHIAPTEESSEVGLFAWNDIPWDELAFPMVKEALNKYQSTKDRQQINLCHMLLSAVGPGQPPAPGVAL